MFLATQEVMKTHTVGKGEHLNIIAKKYGCTAFHIKTWNNLRSNYVKPGQKLTVYVSSRKAAAMASDVASSSKAKSKNTATESVAREGNTKYKYHTVQKGDTLWIIA